MNFKTLIIGEKDIELGIPLFYDFQSGLKYFQSKYDDSKDYIKNLVNDFGIKDRSIVSIASGTGAQEILFADYGNNEVDCIEPDQTSIDINQHFLSEKNKKKIRIFKNTVESFNTDKKYDVIYASSPSDWMRGDFREAITKPHLDFIQKFGKEDTLVIFRLYGGNYDDFVLTSNWFIKSLKIKLGEIGFVIIRHWYNNTDKTDATFIIKRGETKKSTLNAWDKFYPNIIIFLKTMRLVKVAFKKYIL